MAKKVLIVYEKMGMGHFRMASILEDILKGEDVEIVKYAGSEMIQDDSVNMIVRLWNYCIKKNLIKTVDVLLNFLVRILVLPFIEVTSTKLYHDKLDEIKPDIIICTADGFNKAIGSYAKEKSIPFYIFITEVSIFIDLVNPYATHLCYFDETGDAIRSYDFNKTYYSFNIDRATTLMEKIEYVAKYYKDFVLQSYKNSIFRNPDKQLEHINTAKFEVVGPLAEKKHFVEKDITAIKNKFGLSNGRDTVILASGSIGGKFLTEMVEVILKKFQKEINLVVICGRDEDTYNKLKNLNIENEAINLMPLKYIENFDELLAASDCIVGRPSAGIFIESILNGTPEITFRKVTSNDMGTLTMIEKYDIGRVIEKKEEVIGAMEDILSNKEMFKGNIKRLVNSYPKSYESKKEILKDIIMNQASYQYEINEEFNAEVGLNTPLTR